MRELTVTLLLLAPLLPLAAMAFHALHRGRQDGPALGFYWIYGAALAALACLGLQAPQTLRAAAGPYLLGYAGITFSPSLYLDARNAPFLLLLGICVPLIFTWLRPKAGGGFGRSYYIAADLLIASLAGVFVSDSLLLFYLAWELALVGAYFWIGLHGRADAHTPSVYSALVRFFLITLLGSLPMLLSIIALCAAGRRDPGLSGIAELLPGMSSAHRWWIWTGFALAFAVKLPLFGFHGWLRDTYNVSSPACRALLSAAMSKMGAYGLVMVLALAFPQESRAAAPWLQGLCVAGVLYGALLCLVSERLVDILIYSSLAHLGLIGLGIFSGVQGGAADSTALSGALFQILNHGLIMAALFAFDARIALDGESPPLAAAGGLREGQRRLSALLLVAIFASASLPGLSNFAGEILVYFAAFKTSGWLTFLAASGAVVGAAALVRAFHRLFFGPVVAKVRQAPDLSPGDAALGLALAALWIVLGLYPMAFLRPVEGMLLATGVSSLAGAP